MQKVGHHWSMVIYCHVPVITYDHHHDHLWSPMITCDHRWFYQCVHQTTIISSEWLSSAKTIAHSSALRSQLQLPATATAAAACHGYSYSCQPRSQLRLRLPATITAAAACHGHSCRCQPRPQLPLPATATAAAHSHYL